jgi:hypothetical protein
MSGVFQWSQTAASNATADPTVNWAEGQAPSTVNDSARAVMASVAKWRDDLAGLLVTAGTSTAYTLTSNQVFTSLSAMGGQTVSFLVHVANGTSPTLNVDGLGAKPFVIDNLGTALPSASFNISGLYSATYNSSLGQWLVHSQYSGNTLFPSGTLMLFQQTSAPTGWTKQSTHNDKALRVVSGTASSGGTSAFSTVFGLTATSGTVLTQGNLPTFNLNIGSLTVTSSLNSAIQGTNTNLGTTTAYRSSDGTGGAVSQQPSITSTVGGTLASGGSDVPHTHPIELRVQYVDLIIAAKN